MTATGERLQWVGLRSIFYLYEGIEIGRWDLITKAITEYSGSKIHSTKKIRDRVLNAVKVVDEAREINFLCSFIVY